MLGIPDQKSAEALSSDTCLEFESVTIRYGGQEAVRNVSMLIPSGQVTAFIGPSGCGKSTILRSINRLNDLIPGCTLTGRVIFQGHNLYASHIDPVQVRRRIGMVFQKPNPFPKSIYENIAYGARINGFKGDMDSLVERSLRQAAVWDECKDKLEMSGLSLSGGQQQRLCIARAISIAPEVILMDEPCSSLDPISTQKIEELIRSLRGHYTIVIVTHNLQQAYRISDMASFFNVIPTLDGFAKVGVMEEFGPSSQIFNSPQQQTTRDYVSGLFG
ncbi:phosphate ABC transporter ATP-binding protein [Synechococcus sp. Cruz-9H2]|nr:phosphate ABC transporter ATP-binding protein [Synechococcus sp. Cruz-9H2]MCP9844827.1 phosphate ABC transporter ATP-binding protein [Synechococcus sp. Edmonson 11F2]MCP9856892.1 phosphate ABC transporter ATP-binding protein [Synechococcus sp. Cruz-9C9]MCP9864178.1 phosphate ABC transporter ATP-binding protein [Synechococcus sp. Cruz-7E5]MCP9871504.1 phosphate ABC transporter ATP-binding protein [Synechococcus sp. Cruz-7B9]